eukprot:comp59033_c0_seq1/m.47829 comp59033_c0_seq1/g.47829  ORF comp59033_c0_seq1/g.47829 comp59033_c0_seq1/m.47829 type:complete len:122 (-) comp59033_c0_seq1:465-830(-)
MERTRNNYNAWETVTINTNFQRFRRQTSDKHFMMVVKSIFYSMVVVAMTTCVSAKPLKMTVHYVGAEECLVDCVKRDDMCKEACHSGDMWGSEECEVICRQARTTCDQTCTNGKRERRHVF